MKKRIMSLLLAMALALGLAAPAWAQSKYMVKDMPDTSLVLSPGQELEAARRLNALGLFQGVGTNADGTPDFDLDRTPTRVEGIVMLVRLLGEDKEGRKGGWKSPFTDVPTWASSYVGYAYNFQYTKGTSETIFGSMESLDAAQYLTLVLRAMQYEDGTDFQWNAPWELSNALGITDYAPANPGTFTRGTAALWAWNAMSALIANSDRSNIAGQMRLADRLMSYSKITAAQGLNSGLFTGKGGITLSANHMVLVLNDDLSMGLSVKGLPEGSGDLGFTWTSSNPEVASTSTSTRQNAVSIEEHSVGTTVITATSPDGTMSASCTVQVMDTRLRLKLTSGKGANNIDGYTCRLWAETPAEFSVSSWPENSSADKRMIWEVTDRDTGAVLGSDVADIEVLSSDTVKGTSTVSVTMHKTGKFNLICRTRDTKERMYLTVEGASPDIVLSGPDTMEVGQSDSVRVHQVKEYDSSLYVTMWKSSAPDVVEVGAVINDSQFGGGVEALKPGTATITAILNDGREISKTITVVDSTPAPVLNLPGFPLTLEKKDASGELLYRVTITSGSYYGSRVSAGICLNLEGTVDYAAPGAADILLRVSIADDASGAVLGDGSVVIPAKQGAFTYVPDSSSPNIRKTMSNGHTYTLSFQ